MKKVIVAMFHPSDDQYYILLSNDSPHTIVGFKSVQEGISYFTRTYNRSHARGYEPSMSACINFIEFRPRIVEFESFDHLKENVEAHLFTLNHISGHYWVIPVITNGEELYNSGAVPPLIADKEI